MRLLRCCCGLRGVMASSGAAAQTSPDRSMPSSQLPLPRQQAHQDGPGARASSFSFTPCAANLERRSHRAVQEALSVLTVELKGLGSQDAPSGSMRRKPPGASHRIDQHRLPDVTTLVAQHGRALSDTRGCALLRLSRLRRRREPWTPGTGASTASPTTPARPKDKVPTRWTDLCNPSSKQRLVRSARTVIFPASTPSWARKATEKLLNAWARTNPIIQRRHTQRIELMLPRDHMVQGDTISITASACSGKTGRRPTHRGVGTGDGLCGVAVTNRNTSGLRCAFVTDWT